MKKMQDGALTCALPSGVDSQSESVALVGRMPEVVGGPEIV